MFGSRFIKIGSRDRSKILMYARRRVELHASGLPESDSSIDERTHREKLGLSGEFAVATMLGQTLDFIEFEDGEGDGGVDLWHQGTSVDVKTERAQAEGACFRAFPAKYRANVIVFVRQMIEDRYEEFEVLGWLFADEVKRMVSQGDHVDICLCRLRSVEDGLPPDYSCAWPDPDGETHCPKCGWPV